MLAGLGLAETTPGPLILVLQFVGFLAGYRARRRSGAACAAALLTLWVTFAPCFAWIFLGAPFVERLHDQPRLKGALAGVTAAVVGVIANLALWFGLRVLFGAGASACRSARRRSTCRCWSTLQPSALALSRAGGGAAVRAEAWAWRGRSRSAPRRGWRCRSCRPDAAARFLQQPVQDVVAEGRVARDLEVLARQEQRAADIHRA